MILQRLNDLYYRLAQNPDSDSKLARVPPYGFTDENISYCLVLSKDGALVDIQDVRDTSEKKPK
ncbi:MAG: type I-C CRISPR-associated protein Cas8c/Csd1, partial [Betaproteobacteria bacterium]|nr:type I-C CRISPR-associated protein Cas8c/Csd1 [Betaproteobacteria bacterium]